LCLLEEGTKKHKIEEWQKLERIELSLEDIMKDQNDQKIEKGLNNVETTRRRKERREIG